MTPREIEQRRALAERAKLQWKRKQGTLKVVPKLSEHLLQYAVTDFLNIMLPDDIVWSAIDHAAKMSKRQGAERKRRGVKQGLPDYMFVLPPNGQIGWIELKSRLGKLSPAQRVLKVKLEKAGAHYAVCRSLPDVQEALACWGVRLKRVWVRG